MPLFLSGPKLIARPAPPALAQEVPLLLDCLQRWRVVGLRYGLDDPRSLCGNDDGHMAESMATVLDAMITQSAFEPSSSAAVVQDSGSKFLLIQHADEQSQERECMAMLASHGLVRSGISVSYQSSWQLTASGISRLRCFLDLQLEKPALETPPLASAEDMYQASMWALLCHLHRCGWSVLFAKPGKRSKSLPPYCWSDQEATMAFYVRLSKRTRAGPSAASLKRAYLILLCAAELTKLEEAIPHLADAKTYQKLMDVAFPQHSEKRRRKHSLQTHGDFHALLALLDDDANGDAGAAAAETTAAEVSEALAAGEAAGAESAGHDETDDFDDASTDDGVDPDGDGGGGGGGSGSDGHGPDPDGDGGGGGGVFGGDDLGDATVGPLGSGSGSGRELGERSPGEAESGRLVDGDVAAGDNDDVAGFERREHGHGGGFAATAGAAAAVVAVAVVTPVAESQGEGGPAGPGRPPCQVDGAIVHAGAGSPDVQAAVGQGQVPGLASYLPMARRPREDQVHQDDVSAGGNRDGR